MAIVRKAARELTGADGATFVLRDDGKCYYADEDAIAPLWKGQRFPMSACVSGWSMLNRQPVVIEDIYTDPRIPADAYRPTFVKSLVMVPIRTEDPIGAIGNYWAQRRQPAQWEVELLQALANTTAVAMENVELYAGLEQRVRDRTSQLEADNRELEAYAASVAHDLRGPLHMITGYVDLLALEMEASRNERMDGYVARIHGGVRGMSALTEDLLRLARIGRVEMKVEIVDLSALAAELIEGLQQRSPERIAAISIQPDMKICGDAGLLRCALENLVSNAWKYFSKRPHTEIEFSVTTLDDGSTAYCLRDNGAGFDPKQASKLFAPFQRLHRDDEFTGTGVGLATVHRIVQRHGGRIWAESEPDRGAIFYFTLAPQQSGLS